MNTATSTIEQLPPAGSSTVESFLQELVRIPSVNPPGNEGPVAELMARKLSALGFHTQIVESAPGRANLVATLTGTGGGPRLILNGHMDVQPAANGWSVDPFGGEIKDGSLYGRGSMDMKAGLAAAVFGIEQLIRQGKKFSGDLIVAAVADEVCGGHLGTGFLIREGYLKGDFAVICEPTGQQVNVAHRGALWLEIEIAGKSAHGGRPWLGVNAVSKMAAIITAIEQKMLPSLSNRVHRLLPTPTINLGTIAGGTKFNMVADRCVLQVDRRLVPGETVDKVKSEFEDLCETVRQSDHEKFLVTVREVMSVPPSEISEDAPIVQECVRAFQQVTGEAPAIGCTAGFEDAHFFINAGIPAAMFGPYRRNPPNVRFYSNSGGPDEHVRLDDLQTAVRVYAQLVDNLVCAR